MSPHDRTRQHMQKLLAAAIASSAIGSSCHEDHNGSGYGVVDPMPPPARCPGVGPTLKTSITAKREGNDTIVDVTIDRPADRADVMFQASPPYASPGKDLSSSGGASLKARVSVPLGATQVGLSFTIECAAGPNSMNALIRLASPDAGDAGAPPKIEIREF